MFFPVKARKRFRVFTKEKRLDNRLIDGFLLRLTLNLRNAQAIPYMDRLQKIKAYSIENLNYGGLPGSEERDELLKVQVSDIIKTYNPETICMAGAGHGELMLHAAAESDALLVLVDHSLKAIEDFQEMHRADPFLEKIYFVQGDFNNFPIDYYASNLLISIDNINYLESGIVIDEFRRALDFDGLLFVATCLTLSLIHI